MRSTERPAPLVLVTAPGGVGKSHATAHLLRHKQVVWHGERNAMMDELRAFLETPLSGIAPLGVGGAPGSIPTIEKRLARNDPGACSQYDARIAPLRAQDLGRFEKALACRTCPDEGSCAYLNWGPSAPWLFAPHVWLGLKVEEPDLYAGRDVVVVDESPASVMLQSVSLAPHEILALVLALEALPQEPNRPTAGELLRFFSVCLDLLKAPPRRRRVALRDLAEDLGLHTISTIPSLGDIAMDQKTRGRTSAPRQLRPPPERGAVVVDPASLRAVLRQLPVTVPARLRGKVHRLFDALAHDTAERPACVLVLPRPGNQGGIAAGRFVRSPIPQNLPMVVLDATGFPAVYRRLFGDRRIISVSARPDQRARVVQAGDHRYPASTLRASSVAIKRVMRAVARYKRDNPSHKMGLIIKKGLMDVPHVRDEVFKQFRPDDIGHFWAERGKNRFMGYDCLFVVGAPEINHLEMEARTRAFMSLVPPTPGEEPFDYEVVPTKGDDSHHVVVTDGDEGFRQPDRGYADGLRHLVFYEVHTGEYQQAIFRIRPFDDKADEKIAFFFSTVPLDLLGTELVRESELLGQAPELLVRARDELQRIRHAGQTKKIPQKKLASTLGVSAAALSKAKKKHSSLPICKEIEQLLAGPGN